MTLKKRIYIRTMLLIASASIVLTACQNEAVKPSDDDSVIPPACISSGYEPVYTLISSRGYNEKRAPYYPIVSGSGFINRDINNDGLADYLFLEQKIGVSGATLKTCISDKKQTSNYQPRKTRIHFREYKEIENYVESGEVTFDHGYLVISYGSHAHNDGGQNTHKKYAFDRKKNNFILKSFEYHGYGDAYGDNFHLYDLEKKTYYSVTKCTFPNYWGGDISGCKASVINRCLKSDRGGYQIQLGNGVNKATLEKMVVGC